MAFRVLAPNRIRLSGEGGDAIINTYPVGVTTTPGMLVELYKDTDNALKWRPHATATNVQSKFIALNQPEQNRGVDSAYVVGELAEVWSTEAGDMFWGLVPSGQNITAGDNLQSNGDGRLKAATASTAAAGVARYQALETIGAVTADTRLRVQVL